MKSKLLESNPLSRIKGDGPVVLADFASYSVEVVPAFALTENSAYWVCDTKNGGWYKKTMPLHEVDAIEAADARNNSNVRRLIQMLKAWQAWCRVPIKSFYLELLAIEFLDQWANKHQSYFYYDWMCRDFFNWIITKANTPLWAPGTYDMLWLGDGWKTKAESAYARAVKACDFERSNDMMNAGDEWQKIFGLDIPKYVSMDQRAQEIINECKRQQESCNYTSTALYSWLKEVRVYRVAFITLPIIFGSLASAKILLKEPAFDWVTAIAALLAGLFLGDLQGA